MFGVGRNVPNTSRVLLESLDGDCGQAKGLVSHLSLWAPGCELAAAPRVTLLCSFAL